MQVYVLKLNHHRYKKQFVTYTVPIPTLKLLNRINDITIQHAVY